MVKGPDQRLKNFSLAVDVLKRVTQSTGLTRSQAKSKTLEAYVIGRKVPDQSQVIRVDFAAPVGYCSTILGRIDGE